MKNKNLLLTLLTCSLFSCGQSGVNTNIPTKVISYNQDFTQTVEITIDDKKYNLSQDDIFTMSFIGEKHLVFGFLSEKNDIQLTVSAFVTALKPGTYQVYKCREASNCTQEMDDQNQEILFGPYPKYPTPPVNLYRIAYNAPEAGLKPLTLTITSVTDEQQSGVALKTKRIKGQFDGILAYVEKQDTEWKIVGKVTKIKGSFDMFCTIR